MRFSTGRPQDRGLPKPDHRLLSAHPTVSSEFCDRVGHGDITMKPNIERLDGDTVHFVDGTSEHVDLLVYATGYKVTLPFFDRAALRPGRQHDAALRAGAHARASGPVLRRLRADGRVEHPADGDAVRVGRRPHHGRRVLPPEAEIDEWIAADQAAMARRYVRSARHTMQVDFWRYAHALKQCRKARPPTSRRDSRRACRGPLGDRLMRASA